MAYGINECCTGVGRREGRGREVGERGGEVQTHRKRCLNTMKKSDNYGISNNEREREGGEGKGIRYVCSDEKYPSTQEREHTFILPPLF